MVKGWDNNQAETKADDVAGLEIVTHEQAAGEATGTTPLEADEKDDLMEMMEKTLFEMVERDIKASETMKKRKAVAQAVNAKPAQRMGPLMEKKTRY